jgi:hypothetical protein
MYPNRVHIRLVLKAASPLFLKNNFPEIRGRAPEEDNASCLGDAGSYNMRNAAMTEKNRSSNAETEIL